MYLSLTPLTILYLSTNFKSNQAYTRTIPGQTSCYRRCLLLNMLCDPIRNQCIQRNQPTRCRSNQERKFGVCVCRQGWINRGGNCIRQFKGCGEFEGTIGEDSSCRCRNGYAMYPECNGNLQTNGCRGCQQDCSWKQNTRLVNGVCECSSFEYQPAPGYSV